jgi:Bacterial PH domain
MTGPGEPVVYRPVLVRVAYAFTLAGALWWVVVEATGPYPRRLMLGLPIVVAAAALGYAVFWRPAVKVDEHGVRLLNVARDVHVPWERLEEVQTRYALTLVAVGTPYRSWAAAAPGRPSVLRLRRDGTQSAEHLPDPRWTSGGSHAPAASRALNSDSGAAAFIVEQGWTRWRDTPSRLRPAGGPVSVTWNAPVLVVAAASGLLAAVAGALGG